MLFLPIALEAAIRLRRSPRWPQALFLGLAVAGSLLSDQQSAVLVIILVAVILLPWLLGRPWLGRLGPAGRRQRGRAGPVRADQAGHDRAGRADRRGGGQPADRRDGGADPVRRRVHAAGPGISYYTTSGAYLPGMFLASPRVSLYGLTGLKPIVFGGHTGDGVPTFGLVLSLLALLGLITAWRRGNAWLLAVLWLGSAALGLGTTLHLGNPPTCRWPRSGMACGCP